MTHSGHSVAVSPAPSQRRTLVCGDSGNDESMRPRPTRRACLESPMRRPTLRAAARAPGLVAWLAPSSAGAEYRAECRGRVQGNISEAECRGLVQRGGGAVVGASESLIMRITVKRKSGDKRRAAH